jgi:hypothetical protein
MQIRDIHEIEGYLDDIKEILNKEREKEAERGRKMYESILKATDIANEREVIYPWVVSYALETDGDGGEIMFNCYCDIAASTEKKALELFDSEVCKKFPSWCHAVKDSIKVTKITSNTVMFNSTSRRDISENHR